MDPSIIQAAGGIVYCCTHKKLKKMDLLLVHRPKYNDWSLPKGKLLAGESWEQAALREVQEETGYQVKINSFAGPVIYKIGRTLKVVLFWKMSVITGTKFRSSVEVDKIKWMTIPRALSILSYPQEKELVKKTIPDP